jgi:hypothetical protein
MASCEDALMPFISFGIWFHKRGSARQARSVGHEATSIALVALARLDVSVYRYHVRTSATADIIFSGLIIAFALVALGFDLVYAKCNLTWA